MSGRFTYDEIVDMRTMWINGATLQDVIDKYPMSTTNAYSIRRWYTYRGIGPDTTQIGRVQSQNKQVAQRVLERKALIRKYHDAGCSPKQIAYQSGIPQSSVYYHMKLMGMPRHCTTDADRKQMVELYCSGKTQREIAEITGWSFFTVHRIIRKMFARKTNPNGNDRSERNREIVA